MTDYAVLCQDNKFVA